MTASRHPLAYAALALLGLTSLSGCGKEPIRPAMIQPIREPARLDEVVALLQAGQVKKAEKSLKSRIKKDPTDRDAALLLRSLTEDPRTLLGTENFAYVVKSGDDYMSLAQRYLGDRFKFYALIRYNGERGYALLKPGAAIMIPGAKPREAAVPPAPTEPRQKRSAAPAKAPVAATPPKAVKADPARAAKLRAAGLNALNRGQVAQAVNVLRAAAAAAPDDVLIKRDLARAERLYKSVRAKG